ncbi:iron export ABC transporter permease subunit FetB [Alicyclobacillus sp. SO9]|uniref:ABC transporter permease n=1 Tax=Alicyclobacillus sp. SO9 TaxID=2665646 RepID=UPI0018E6DFF7|nr:iron export ABC transporter permease subunit FetB [Alicyclobacillus sp. SO9]QQE77203.1 iron export ABC transporter permease subunit FetB [Alicyclobacillus sp. SO9]
MSFVSLGFTLAFVALALIVAVWRRLGIERDLVIAVIRATIQLLAVGYILKFVFTAKTPVYTILMVLLMIGVAVMNAKNRGQGLRGIWWRLAIAITLTTVFTVGFLLIVHIIPWQPRYVIPLSGLMTGNSMVLSSLFLNRLASETRARKEEINVLLSLGAAPHQAAQHVVKHSIKASMIPTIDTMKTIGLVQLPGIMTGLILGGADPIQAVRYQLLIIFALLSAAALTSVTLGILTQDSLFNRHQQVIESLQRKEA